MNVVTCARQTAWRRAVLIVATVTAAAAAGVPLDAAPPPAAGAEASAATAAEVEATLGRYCATCHNERIVSGRDTAPSMLVSQLRTAGLAFDGIDVEQVGADADAWERVIRKLQSRTMPPPGRPRPDEATYDDVVAWIEAELDEAAAAAPNPGRRPALHRLTRTEYQNAVRDLLALDPPAEGVRRHDAAAGRQRDEWLRQPGGAAVRFACDARALPGGSAQDQPSRGGRHDDAADRRPLPVGPRSDSGRPPRRPSRLARAAAR